MLSFEKSPNGHYIVRTTDGRTYGWRGVTDNRFHDLTTSGYAIDIVYNSTNKAMINIVDPATGRDVLRQSVNPLTHVQYDDWVVDDQ